MDKKQGNSKMKEDIQKKLEAKQAKLAIEVLGRVEKGEKYGQEIRKVAQRIFESEEVDETK